jgi:hypothetical protein
MDQLSDAIINHALAGDDTSLDLSSFADEIGQPEGLLKMYTDDIVSGFQAQADNALKAHGVDLVEFYGFLQEEHPGKLREAIQTHYRTKNPGVWQSLIPLYRQSVMPSEEALKRAGIPVTKKGNDTMVTIHGTMMSLKAAVRAGFL